MLLAEPAGRGVPCMPGAGACPRGQACEEVVGGFACVAPGTGTGTGDPDAAVAPPEPDADLNTNDDHDGIRNSDDNCPTIREPGSRRNEDGDRFGDACDPCPILWRTRSR